MQFSDELVALRSALTEAGSAVQRLPEETGDENANLALATFRLKLVRLRQDADRLEKKLQMLAKS